MKFNAKYNRYVSKDGLVYRLKDGVLQLCKDLYNGHGYVRCSVQGGSAYVHRIVFETFNSEIPEGYEIDHINSVRDDNRLCNLQILTRSENCRKRRPYSKSVFGRLFMEHYNTTSKDNLNLYMREYMYYKQHNNTCRWENTQEI